MVVRERHRDPYRAFFTDDETLGRYMASLLYLVEGDTVFEPAAGDGHLIEAVQKANSNLYITAYELHPNQTSNLQKKFSKDPTVRVVKEDTILCPNLELREKFGPRFSKIIANPPYGGWQECERRADLKKRFRGFYVRETYTLFLLRCLRLLKENGKLVFIIPNTFLYLHLHESLREYILKEFSIETIDVFKSSLFPRISFGHADLCIISISRKKTKAHHLFRLRFVDEISEFESPDHIEANSKFILQKDILRNHSYTIPVFPGQIAVEELSRNGLTVADIADCVTGFYSGNDKHFLRCASISVKRSNGYHIVDPNRVERQPEGVPHILNGLSGRCTFVPILKGGGYHFLKPNMWFVNWSKECVAHYKSDRKSRFQNSSYYFRKGIGFPMVTSTKPTASLIQESLFDQSIVGIFPKRISLEFLLAYCNSTPFWVCLKAINPSANNSAKYVLRTPIILPDHDEEELIARQTRELLEILKVGEAGADSLQKEILDSIYQYVKRKERNKTLDLTVLRAVAQL